MNLTKSPSEQSFISKILLKIQQGWKQNIIVLQLALVVALFSPNPFVGIPLAIMVGTLMILLSAVFIPNFFYEVELQLKKIFHGFSPSSYENASPGIKKLLLQKRLIVFLWCAWTLLFFMFMESYEPFYLFIYFFSICPIIFFYFLSKKENRKVSILFYVANLTWVLFIIILIPEHMVVSDPPSDTATYQWGALEMVRYWNELKLNPVIFHLTNFVSSGSEEVALPPYPVLIGSRHYSYHIFLGFIYYFTTKIENILAIIILCQIIMIATLTPACFNIAINFFKSRTVATTSCICIMLSTITLVPLFLLKEALSICIFLLSIFIIGEFLTRYNRRRFFYLVILFFLLALLVMTRVHLAFTLCAVLGGSMLIKPFRNIEHFCGVILLLTMMLFTTSYLGSHYPHSIGLLNGQQAIKIEYSFLKNPTAPLSEREDFVLEWHWKLGEEPVQAIVTAIGKSFFSPYAGNIFHRPINFTFGELFYFISLMYLIFFPFLVIGLISSFRSGMSILFTGIIVMVMAIYIFHMGECSTRQRLTIDPLLLILIAYGREQIFKKNQTSQNTGLT